MHLKDSIWSKLGKKDKRRKPTEQFVFVVQANYLVTIVELGINLAKKKTLLPDKGKMVVTKRRSDLFKVHTHKMLAFRKCMRTFKRSLLNSYPTLTMPWLNW